MAQLWLVTGIALVAVLGAGKGIDATFRHPISGFPQADALAADGGRLAALGQGWSRHLDQWSPPDSRKQVDSARPVAKQPAVPSAIESLPVPVGEPDSATSDDSDDTFLPPRTPAMPLLASLTPPTTVRREDIALPGAGARMDGQANVMPLFTVNPRYPEAAHQQGLEGQVKLRFKVDLQGRAVDIEVIHSQPESVFDHAAIEALQQWTFQVNTGHDTGLLLAQAFDFSWEEVNEPSRRLHTKDCLRTGTRVCAYPYTDEHVVKLRPQSAAINEPK
jgi:protein TonB